MAKWQQGALIVSALIAVQGLSAQGPRTYANPVDIDCRYNWGRGNDRVSFRTGAETPS